MVSQPAFSHFPAPVPQCEEHSSAPGGPPDHTAQGAGRDPAHQPLPAFVLMLWFGPRCLRPHSNAVSEARHGCHTALGGGRTRSPTWQSGRLRAFFICLFFLAISVLWLIVVMPSVFSVEYYLWGSWSSWTVYSHTYYHEIKYIHLVLCPAALNCSLDWFKIWPSFMQFYAWMLTESLDQGWANFWTGGPQWVVKFDRGGWSRSQSEFW